MRALVLVAAGLLAVCADPLAAQQLAQPPAQVAVSVLAHSVQRGDRLSAGDFEADSRPAYAARDALRPRDAEGKEAVRNLPSGSVLHTSDVMTPRLVHRGEPVTIRYVNGGLTIASSGRALSDGGHGDAVRVVTDPGSRTLEALVEGAGSVRVMP